MKKISVVMPTKNRAAGLKNVIDRLLRQSLKLSHYELIIVDNGSIDETRQVVNDYVDKYKDHVSYLYCARQGAASARNLGAYNAKAEYILFLDDDMIADSNLIETHLKYHEIYDGSILGYIKTDWEVGANAFLKYLESSGCQNAFPFNDGDTVDYRFFYTGNISVRKKSFKTCNGFDEGFKVYGYEDMDLGHRMAISGEKTFFSKNALSYHDYHPERKHFLKKRVLSGYSLGYLLYKYPYLSNHFLIGKVSLIKYLFFRLCSPFVLCFNRRSLNNLKSRCFDALIRWNILRGLIKFKSDNNAETLYDLLR